MSRNRVQFRKGFSLKKFLEDYGAEEQFHYALCKGDGQMVSNVPTAGVLAVR